MNMNCDVIQDLIPLFVDGCCSAESGRLVEEHIQSCGKCRACLESVQKPLPQTGVVPVPKTSRLSEWKASMLQSILFLLYFAVITMGVALEAKTPSGLMNGFWAFALVVPATGFLLSLVNWYFIRIYKNKRSFVIGSLVCTVVASACCFLFSAIHYEVPLMDLKLLFHMAFGYSFTGTVFFCMNLILSIILSMSYAKMVGKE